MAKMECTKYNDLHLRIKQNKNWFDDFMILVQEYYKTNSTGGSLHIVLDDGNIEKDHVRWCAGYACGKGDDDGGDIANLMLAMSWKQRKMVYESGLY